jgi:glucose-1-phosphate thymidylyltransferase
MDMVELDGNDRVCKIEIKPASTTLRYTWIIAVWTAGFSRFMHESVRDRQAKIKSTQSERDKQPEVFVGDIIQEAIAAGLRIDKVVFADGEYLDIGTPEDLARIPQFLQKRQAGQAGLLAASKPPELG